MKKSTSPSVRPTENKSNHEVSSTHSAGVKSGRTTSAQDVNETPEEKIARLERALEDACLRADLYEEIINIAEAKFDIQIRKKAGTKR